jgi:hypothetical protein
MKRRDFIKYLSGGLAGLAVGGTTRIPLIGLRGALASTTAWKFGVLADTQWVQRTGTDPGEYLSCAVTIIDALNEEFIRHGCKFVIQVGDLVDKESVDGVRSLPTRAAHAEALYLNDIGFFPVRGNHEASQTAAGEMLTLFPQTVGNSPYLFGAANFESPVMSSTSTDPAGARLKGLSYSFDYENVRCVLIDQFTRIDGSSYNNSNNNNAVDQVEWVDAMLSSRDSDSHAFVFAHKNLIGQNHKDVLFGSNLTANSSARDDFLSSLYSNRAGYYLGGHDHMHHRSIVTTSDRLSSASQIICSSNSYKFYIPQSGDDGRETPLQQELFTIGYYIFTIDGPRVTVDFYSSSHGSDYGDLNLLYAPGFNFYLRETFGYSLNGKQFQIAQGESYTSIKDSYGSTTARILSGTNGNTETDYLGRDLTKIVNTGWSAPLVDDAAASNVLSLWGMADNLSLYDENLTGLLPDSAESKEGDVFTLSLTYDSKKVRPSQLVSGKFGLAARNESGAWINAVETNSGGSKTFKYGPWRSTYGLGTYGVDPSTRTVWAVVNHDGDFVAKSI